MSYVTRYTRIIQRYFEVIDIGSVIVVDLFNRLFYCDLDTFCN